MSSTNKDHGGLTERGMEMKWARINTSYTLTMTAVVIDYVDGDIVIGMVVDDYDTCVVRRTTVMWPS